MRERKINIMNFVSIYKLIKIDTHFRFQYWNVSCFFYVAIFHFHFSNNFVVVVVALFAI